MPSPIVVYDACVLYPAPLRDLLLRLAGIGLFRARWSEEILDEAFRNLAADRPDLAPEKLANTRRLMCEAIPECLVTGYSSLVPRLEMPDPGDRHVLAAAIFCKARVIVTDNTKDFPPTLLAGYGIEAQTADEFVYGLVVEAPDVVCEVIRKQAGSLKRPTLTVRQLLDRFRGAGLARSTAALRELLEGSRDS